MEFHFDRADLRLWEPTKQGYLRTLPESVQRLDIAAARCQAEVRASREAEQLADDERRHPDAVAQVRRVAEALLAAHEEVLSTSAVTRKLLG